MYTDLHCHLLYGIDDGAKDPLEAVAMARALAGLGFGAVAPSPHAWPDLAGPEACDARRRELAALLEQEGVPLALYSNAENTLDSEFLERELAGQGRHVNGTRYVLVEAPYHSVVPALPDLLFRLRRKGVRPVLAHPERCAEFQELERAEQAVRSGAHLQLDLGSLAGQYGKAVRKTAVRLLEAGLYAVAATDLHHAERAERTVAEALGELKKLAGQSAVEKLLERNPAHLVRDEELE